MAQSSVRLRLEDILEAIEEIQTLLRGTLFEQFTATRHWQRATERNLEIISEASRFIPNDLKALATNIQWREIAAIGNLLRHEYQRVEPLIIWNIVEQHLDQLKSAINELHTRLGD